MRDDDHQELMRRLGVPARLLTGPADRTTPPASSSVGTGELPGVRAVMDRMIERGEDPATVHGVARKYDQLVRDGVEPPPKVR